MASASSSCPSKSTFLSTGLQGLNLGDLRLPTEAAVMPPPPPPPTSAVTTTTTRTGAIPKVSHPPIVLGRLEKCASASSVVGTTTADSAPISSSAAASSSPASTSKKRRNRRQRRRRTVDDNGGKPPPALVLAAAAKGGDGVEDEDEEEELPVDHDSNSEMPRPAGVLADLTMLEKVERRVPGFNPGEGADEVARRFLEALREDDMGLDGGGKQPEQTKEEQDEEPPKHNIPPESFSSATPVSARKTAGGGSRRRRRKRKKQRSPDKEEVDKENKFSAAAAAEPKSEDDEDDEEGEDGESSGEPRKFVWRNVVKSGAVKKCVLVEGRMEGGRPAAGDTVLVRSQGKLRDGTIVDDHSTLVFNVGEHEVVEGLDLAVRSMHKNELSIVSVKPEAAYGELGRKGDVPAGARITYLFGLMHFEKQKEICQLTWAQRRKCGQSRMRLANWWYQRKEYPVAVKCYKRALEYYNNIPTNQECSTAEEYKELLQLMEERLRIMRQVASIFKRIANLIQSGQISS